MIDVEVWPELRDPVFVVALSGWVDAGLAGSTAAEHLREQLGAARVFGRLDLSNLVDLQQTRPQVSIVDGTTRRVNWPVIELVAGRAGRDVVLCTGPEPSLRWPSVIAALVGVATRVGVVSAFGLGAMPSVSTHRRPMEITATVTDDTLIGVAGALRTDYVGMTGMQTALLVAMGEAGIPGIGLWAQVPHYVAGSPSPPAARAVLGRLAELADVALDLSELDLESAGYADKVEEGLAERPDVAELVEAIESEHPAIPTGDELVTEIERFLRSQPDQD